MLPGSFDLGSYRTRAPASDWNFRKLLNMEMGLSAQPFVQICDLELLSYRRGASLAFDRRGWFASKQLCSADLCVTSPKR